jgi:uncharacterized Zn finger protein (UPF0148 family)
MTYYNERNGWTDKGKKITNRCCPNCRSKNFIETISREYCPDCKLECDYWGGGSNKVYDQMMENKWAREQDEREARIRRQLREEQNDDYDYD